MQATATVLFSLILFALWALSVSCASGGSGDAAAGTDVRGTEVEYEGGGATMRGWFAYDANRSGPRPGVLVVHEWWGTNDYTRRRARMLAEMGYAALAVDMYGDGRQADHPEQAKAFMDEVMSDMAAAEARFRAAQEWLAAQPQTDAEHIAAIGYCFGGAVVLHMARAGDDLDGVASFHGMLATDRPARPGRVQAAALVCHGADDPFVPAEQVEAFRTEMAKASVDLEFHAYPGAVHAFTNPAATAKKGF